MTFEVFATFGAGSLLLAIFILIALEAFDD